MESAIAIPFILKKLTVILNRWYGLGLVLVASFGGSCRAGSGVRPLKPFHKERDPVGSLDLGLVPEPGLGLGNIGVG